MKDALPRVVDDGQAYLLPLMLNEVLDQTGISFWTAIQLYKEKLISFDPEKTNELDEKEELEAIRECVQELLEGEA
ncbi:MAG: hypothetical protein EOM12_07520 [Verrucomicrobiae bacterium]|nr:hypothetical protein [Verrucomicrobiae bacterium]